MSVKNKNHAKMTLYASKSQIPAFTTWFLVFLKTFIPSSLILSPLKKQKVMFAVACLDMRGRIARSISMSASPILAPLAEAHVRT